MEIRHLYRAGGAPTASRTFSLPFARRHRGGDAVASLCRCKFTVAQVPWVTLESQVVLVVVTSSLLVARARFGLGVIWVAGVRRRVLDGLRARRCATLRLLVGLIGRLGAQAAVTSLSAVEPSAAWYLIR